MSDRMSWGEYAYAGFWRRLGGILIDGLVLSAITSVLAAFIGPQVLVEPIDPQTFQVRPGWIPAAAGWSLVTVVVFLAYETAMLSTLGWTLGKRVVGVEVRGADGAILSVPRALGRALGKFVSGLPLYLGFLWAAWDPRKQAWHDKFVSSFALKRSWLEPVGQVRPEQLRPQARTGADQSPWGIPGRPESAPGATRTEALGAAPGGLGVWQTGPERETASEPQTPPPARDAPPGAGTPATEAAEPASADGPELEGAEPASAHGPAESAAATGPGEPTTGPSTPDAPPAAPPGEEPAIRERLELDTAEDGPAATAPAPGVPEPHPQPEARPPQEDAPVPEQEAGPDNEPVPEQEPGRGQEPAAAAETHRDDAAAAGGSPPEDPDLVAIVQAGLAPESAAWLDQVANQVDPRLDRVAPGWRSAPQAAAARACAFGLLLGYLAQRYPHMAADLSRVAEQHPSYSTLPAGRRLETLQGITADPGRATAWLGPLIGVEDPDRLRALFD